MNRFGVREVCDVVFKPLSSVDIGSQHFDAMQPALYIDTATTSSLEQAVTTVYAQGGKGSPRLIGWDGEKQVTFSFTDALMSATSFSVLSGAGVIRGSKGGSDGAGAEPVYVHATYELPIEKNGEQFVAKLTAEDRNNADLVVSKEAPIYPVVLDSAGAAARFLSAVTDKEVMVMGAESTLAAATFTNKGILKSNGQDVYFVLGSETNGDERLDANLTTGDTVRIDCYEVHYEDAYELSIAADEFGGYYYIEASTLFRDEATGKDLPAEFIIPRGKIQSNFTFTMGASGDPSTFDFKVDCFPAYTKFNKKKKVQALLQIIDTTAATAHDYSDKNILGHNNRTSDADVDGYYTKSVFSE